MYELEELEVHFQSMIATLMQKMLDEEFDNIEYMEGYINSLKHSLAKVQEKRKLYEQRNSCIKDK